MHLKSSSLSCHFREKSGKTMNSDQTTHRLVLFKKKKKFKMAPFWAELGMFC
jgi:hypothetical protein